jgi:CelD/BcsL family acetyltransferase involved in cellulose biosynthesis
MALTRLAPVAVSSAVEVREVTTLADFDAMRTDWNQLVDQLEVPSPFQSWEWNRAWWNHFGEGRSLLILEFRQAGRVIGVAPLFRRRIGTPGLGLSMLLPLGWEGNGLANGLTEQWELLFPADCRMALLERLACWLQTHPWSTVLIPGFAETDPLPEWMVRRIAYRGKGVVFDHRRIPASWEALVASLNKSMRDNVRYYPRLMQRRGHSYVFEVASTPAEISATLPLLFNLHRERAVASMRIAHDDYFDYPNRRSFIREVAPTLAERGQVRIGTIRVGDERIAIQMWLEKGETMFLYYSGFLPSWQAHSVALLATIGAFQDAMRRGIRQIEFLAGGGHPKERWDTEQRVHSNIWLVRRPGMTRFLLNLPIHYRHLA